MTQLPSAAERLGQALRRLRVRKGLSQEQAAKAAGTHQQTWGKWETAGNDALLKINRQDAAIAALGATREEFDAELEMVEEGAPPYRPAPEPPRAIQGVSERPAIFEFPAGGRVKAGPQGLSVSATTELQKVDLSHLFGPSMRILPISGESMIPYAQPGGWISYDIHRSPRRGDGCVIAFEDGDLLLKRFEYVRDGILHVTELFPKEQELTFPMSSVLGIYAAGFRVD